MADGSEKQAAGESPKKLPSKFACPACGGYLPLFGSYQCPDCKTTVCPKCKADHIRDCKGACSTDGQAKTAPSDEPAKEPKPVESPKIAKAAPAVEAAPAASAPATTAAEPATASARRGCSSCGEHILSYQRWACPKCRKEFCKVCFGKHKGNCTAEEPSEDVGERDADQYAVRTAAIKETAQKADDNLDALVQKQCCSCKEYFYINYHCQSCGDDFCIPCYEKHKEHCKVASEPVKPADEPAKEASAAKAVESAKSTPACPGPEPQKEETNVPGKKVCSSCGEHLLSYTRWVCPNCRKDFCKNCHSKHISTCKPAETMDSGESIKIIPAEKPKSKGKKAKDIDLNAPMGKNCATCGDVLTTYTVYRCRICGRDFCLKCKGEHTATCKEEVPEESEEEKAPIIAKTVLTAQESKRVRYVRRTAILSLSLVLVILLTMLFTMDNGVDLLGEGYWLGGTTTTTLMPVDCSGIINANSKDLCYMDQGMKEHNLSKCAKVSDKEYRAGCNGAVDTYMGVSTHNLTFCDNISVEKDRAPCNSDVNTYLAAKNKDPGRCGYDPICRGLVATVAKDPGYCGRGISFPYTNIGCYDYVNYVYYYQKALQTNDSRYCDGMLGFPKEYTTYKDVVKNHELRGICFMTLAVRAKNASLCDNAEGRYCRKGHTQCWDAKPLCKDIIENKTGYNAKLSIWDDVFEASKDKYPPLLEHYEKYWGQYQPAKTASIKG